MSHKYKNQINELDNHFSDLVTKYGDGPDSVQWSDEATQRKRFEILCQIDNLQSAKVLDFGCGNGELLRYMVDELDFKGEYLGIDLSIKMIELCQNKFPNFRFEARDILENPLTERFDYVLISGIFNQKVGHDEELAQQLLHALFLQADKGLAFNALSTYVDFFAENLNYMNPDTVFRFCKEKLSAQVCLRHDYLLKSDCLPYEYTVFVRRSTFPSRPNLFQNPVTS